MEAEAAFVMVVTPVVEKLVSCGTVRHAIPTRKASSLC